MTIHHMLVAFCFLLLTFLVAGDGTMSAARAEGERFTLTSEEIATAGFNPEESAGLFVGVRSFEDNDAIAEVPFAVDDAVDLAHLFSLELGIIAPKRVTLALSGEPVSLKSIRHLANLLDSGAERVDAGYTTLLRQLIRVTKKSGARGVLLVSIATHGYILESTSNEFLLGRDSSLGYLDRTGIPVTTVFDHVSRSISPRRIVLLDACRERVEQTRGIASARGRMSQEFGDAIAGAQGMAILQATTPGGYSYDDPKRGNGVFTSEIIAGLRGGASADDRGFITPATLADYVDTQVKRWVRENRPEHDTVSTGISYRTEDMRAARMPLAINARALARHSESLSRRARLLGVLQAQMDFKTITGSMVDAVAEALEKEQADESEEILTQLEFLEQIGARYKGQFAGWWINRAMKRSEAPEAANSSTSITSQQEFPGGAGSSRMSTAPQEPQEVKAAQITAILPEGFSAVSAKLDPASGFPMKIRHDVSGYELVLIAAGEFFMGNSGGEQDEQPQHRVWLDAYYIGVTEVSNGNVRATWPHHSAGSYSGYNVDGENQPILNINWDEAKTWCDKNSMQLPTEAQWEKAARGGDGRTYPWGNEWPPTKAVGNFSDNTAVRVGQISFPITRDYNDRFVVTSPGGTFASDEPYGALDMAGNVWELCADWYSATYYSASPEKNPPGPASGAWRVRRGGSWMSTHKDDLKTTSRDRFAPARRMYDVGFRAALDPSPKSAARPVR